jgi:hypothetical protein
LSHLTALHIEEIYQGAFVMDDRIARLRNYQRNIGRYQNMLKTRLSEVELRFVEKRLSEERFKIAMLEFLSPPQFLQSAIDPQCGSNV